MISGKPSIHHKFAIIPVSKNQKMHWSLIWPPVATAPFFPTPTYRGSKTHNPGFFPQFPTCAGSLGAKY